MSTIKIKRSAVPGKIPVDGDIDLGELAINTYDGKLFLKKSVAGANTIVDVSAGLSDIDILNAVKRVDGTGSGLDSDLLDGQDGSYYLNWTNTTNKPSPNITVTLTGDVTGSANTTLTNLANGSISISTTIAADSVALGTDTSGNYVASITNGSFITGGNGGSEGAALTLAVDATSTATASKVVARDTSGNFSANTITAALSGNASTATALQTARTINGTSFNGTANITITSNTPNALTFNSGGGGAVSGSTFDGGSAVTVSYNTVGASPLAGSTSLTTAGTITIGTWNGSLITGTYGGTGVNNGSRTITIGGNVSTANSFTTSGNFALTLTQTAATNVTLPTSGTLISSADTGTVTSTMIADGTIVNADINASAAIADTKLATISTAGKVLNSATTASSTNTASAIVARDASGNFAAGTITASLTGNASTATNANYATSAGNANTLDNLDSTHFLNYNNLSNKPTIGNATITISPGTGLTTGGAFTTNQTTSETISLAVNFADTAEAAAGTSSTVVMSPLRVQQAINANAITPLYSSSNVSFALGATYSFTHGLGRNPRAVFLYLYCATAEAGYSVGEYYGPVGAISATFGSNNGISISNTSTAIKVTTGSNEIFVLANGTGSRVGINPSNWRLKVYAW